MDILPIIKSIAMNSEANLRNGNTYMGEDGFLHCKACGDALQMFVELDGENGKEKIKVPCRECQCKKAENKAIEERERREQLESRRKACFKKSNMSSWNFENDDRTDARLSNAMLRYADGFESFKDQKHNGLLLFGTVGTGKSYFAACIANKLIDNGHSVLMTNFSQLTNTISGMYEGKEEYIESLNRYSLLIIDDLGIERNTEYMKEMVFNIIDSRYRSGKPMIITTNLTWEEITKPQDAGYSRIYDRIIERCTPIEVTGASRRRQKLKDSFLDVRSKLGL